MAIGRGDLSRRPGRTERQDGMQRFWAASGEICEQPLPDTLVWRRLSESSASAARRYSPVPPTTIGR